MPSWSFTLPGRCPTKGSLKAIQRDSGGVYLQDKGLLWQKQAMNELSDAWGGQPLIAEFTLVSLLIRYERPKKSRFAKPTQDVDKLARRVMDALTGTIFQDDKWVAPLLVNKEWAERDEVVVTIEVKQ